MADKRVTNKNMYDLSLLMFGKSQNFLAKGSQFLSGAAATEMNALQYSINAETASKDSNQAVLQGLEQVQAVQIKGAEFRGEQEAAMSASGFAIDVGTSAKALQRTDEEFVKTMATIVRNSEFKAADIEFQAETLRINAELSKDLASIQSFQGISNALMGLVSAGMSYHSYKKSGYK